MTEEGQEDILEEKALEAGFNATDIVPEATVEIQDETATEQSQPTDKKPEPKFTDDDLQAVMQRVNGEFGKNFDRVFGKIGELNQRLATVQSLKEEALRISPKARERLRDEFPELETLLFDDDEGETKEEAPSEQQSDTPPKSSTSQTTNQMTAEQIVERRLLKRDHPDWEALVVAPDFIAWTEKLPAQEKERLRSTWDADYVSEKLTEFKSFKGVALAKKSKDDKNKKERLDAAIIPRGMPNQSDLRSDTDDEEAAMIKAYRRR